MRFSGQTLKSGDCQDPSRKTSQLAALLTTNLLPNSPCVRKTLTEMLEQLWMHRSTAAIASPSYETTQLLVTALQGSGTVTSPPALAWWHSSRAPWGHLMGEFRSLQKKCHVGVSAVIPAQLYPSGWE